MNYNDRVRQMAEKMAELDHNSSLNILVYGCDYQTWKAQRADKPNLINDRIDMFIPSATLAVTEQAEAVREALRYEVEAEDWYINQYLLDNGYVKPE